MRYGQFQSTYFKNKTPMHVPAFVIISKTIHYSKLDKPAGSNLCFTKILHHYKLHSLYFKGITPLQVLEPLHYNFSRPLGTGQVNSGHVGCVSRDPTSEASISLDTLMVQMAVKLCFYISHCRIPRRPSTPISRDVIFPDFTAHPDFPERPVRLEWIAPIYSKIKYNEVKRSLFIYSGLWPQPNHIYSGLCPQQNHISEFYRHSWRIRWCVSNWGYINFHHLCLPFDVFGN